MSEQGYEWFIVYRDAKQGNRELTSRTFEAEAAMLQAVEDMKYQLHLNDIRKFRKDKGSDAPAVQLS